MIFLEATLTFRELRIDTNRLWLINKVAYTVKYASRYNVNEELHIKYDIYQDKDSVKHYTAMSEVILGMTIDNGGEYWFQFNPGGYYSFHTDQNYFHYFSNDDEISDFHMNRMLEILKPKNEIDIRFTNLFETYYINGSMIPGQSISDFRKKYGVN